MPLTEVFDEGRLDGARLSIVDVDCVEKTGDTRPETCVMLEKGVQDATLLR